MEIRNRLFPYPVLCEENDDYIDCYFNVECSVIEELTNILLDIKFKLTNNEELDWLIREGWAEFVLHIECTYTAFRTIVKTSGNRMSYRIPKSKVNVELNLVGAIVASKNIESFKSEKLNEDYLDEEIQLERGAILAYCNLPKIFVTKNYEELSADDAFFSIIRRVKNDENEKNPVVYDISGPKIKILVDDTIYDEYVKYHNNINMESIATSLLVMPALIYMIEYLRSEDLDKYKALYWFQKINKACELQNIDFVDDLIFSDTKTSIEIAQDILQLPINRAFADLSKIIEG